MHGFCTSCINLQNVTLDDGKIIEMCVGWTWKWICWPDIFVLLFLMTVIFSWMFWPEIKYWWKKK